jgi:DNA-binding GntR family transcriptional regulator
MMADEIKDRGTGLDADALFTCVSQRPAGNSALVHVVHQLWNFRSSAMFRKLDEHFDSLERHEQAIEEHRRLVDAIEKRDAEGARAAMKLHLDTVRAALERGWELANVNGGTPANPPRLTGTTAWS